MSEHLKNGEIFIYGDKHYKVIEKEVNDCGGCVFMGGPCPGDSTVETFDGQDKEFDCGIESQICKEVGVG